MNQATRIARMKSSAFADIGRRITSPESSAVSPSRQGTTAAASPPNVAAEVSLSDALKLALRLGAQACGIDQPEFVRRAIAEKAIAAGLPGLADAAARDNHTVVGYDLARGEDVMAIAVRDESGAYILLTNSEGDLTDVPPMPRRAIPRFASGP